MIATQTPRLAGPTRLFTALFVSTATFLAGCSSNMTTTAVSSSPGTSQSVHATIGGHVHGGNQPVSGATITLYYAGHRPTGATAAAVTTTAADGSFSFTKDPINDNEANDTGNTYSCPSATPLVYVVASGGNTQNNGNSAQSNPAAKFIGIYGMCSNINAGSFLELSEVTTVATMVAVQQFFDPVAESLVWDGTGQAYNIMENINSTIALLADTSAGTAVTSTTLNAAGSNINSAVTVTATPEAGKINLLANIIASCVNTADGTQPACNALFAAAPPPSINSSSDTVLGLTSFPSPTDTLQALFYILVNPTNGSAANLSNIDGLAGALGGPYQPAMSSLPTDWTVAINYTSTSTCGSVSGGSGSFIASPTDINVDGSGNIWITNKQGSVGNLSEISVTGVPSTCVFLGDGGSQSGGAVDIAGNLWIGTGTSVYRYTPAGNALLQFPVGVAPLEVTTDGLGNVYFTAVSGSTGSVYEIVAGSSASSATAPVQIATNVGSSPAHLMPDFAGTAKNSSGATVAVQGNIWVTSGGSNVFELSPSTADGNTGGFVTTSYATGGANSYGLSINKANGIFVSDSVSGAITSLTLTNGAYTANWIYSGTTAGISSPTALAVDGASNAWIANNANGTSTGSISALTDAETPISPSTGFQKPLSYLSSGRALAIDQSGNVWVGGDGANFVTEIIGAAVPIYGPYSMGLQNGRYQSIN